MYKIDTAMGNVKGGGNANYCSLAEDIKRNIKGIGIKCPMELLQNVFVLGTS